MNRPQPLPRPRRAGSRPPVERGGKPGCHYRDGVDGADHSGLVWTDHPVDIVDALDLLGSCVRDRGEGHRSRRRGDGVPTATDSIVILALTKAGAPLTALRPLTHTPIADLYASGQHPLPLTLGAVVVFRAAESEDRRGQTWGMSLQAALRAASRFVDLVPDRVVSSAVEAVAASRRGA
jgi:hypothetical protein